MDYWIIPSNDNTFRIGDAIVAQEGMADWRTDKFSVGDIVFIYKTRPEQCIRYRMEVIKVNIGPEDTLDQEAFWTDKDIFYGGISSPSARLKLLEEYSKDRFTLDFLRAHGLSHDIQSVMRCKQEILDLLFHSGTIKEITYDSIDYSEDDNTLYEGALMKVLVNKYERNPKARRECVEKKGYQCLVCGRDFEATYGKIGKNFIHVHHLTPISTIGKEYELNVEKDLVPVCPNCHYMLHRKEPPYTIEELREIMLKTNDFRKEDPKIIPLSTYQEGCIPLYDLRAACGSFEENEKPEVQGWVDATGHGFTPNPDSHFAIYAKGDSMLPKIHNNDICVFERYTGGSRNGEIVLIQCDGVDPDTGFNYTIKKYHSIKVITEDGWRHESITLSPLNPEYNDIQLTPNGNYVPIGVFKCTLN